MKNPQKSVVDALNGVEALVQALESFAVNRAAGGPTAQDMAEVVAWELNLLPVEPTGDSPSLGSNSYRRCGETPTA